MPTSIHESSGSVTSHPSRVRGLKFSSWLSIGYRFWVAPFTGAWIEISWTPLCAPLASSRTLHGCVDWNFTYTMFNTKKERRTLHGCVDWNKGYGYLREFRMQSRTLHGCVDWNIICNYLTLRLWRVAPFRGAWIEIVNHTPQVLCAKLSHPSGVRGLKFVVWTPKLFL